MINKYYAVLDSDGFVLHVRTIPIEEGAEVDDGIFGGVPHHLLDGPIIWESAPSTGCKLKLVGDVLEWVDPRTLDQARADKIAEMSFACATAIFAGFTSSALGAEYLYPAKMTDQSNLAGSILDSLIPGPADWTTPFWCADASGTWAFRMHTSTQIQQVGRNGKTAILAAMSYNEALRAQIETATMAQLDVIVWAP